MESTLALEKILSWHSTDIRLVATEGCLALVKESIDVLVIRPDGECAMPRFLVDEVHTNHSNVAA